MTDRKQALTDLLKKVEAGSDIYRPITFVNAFKPLLGYEAAINPADSARRSYHGSLDAAKALHEAVLPGWGAQIHAHGHAEVRHPKLMRRDLAWAVVDNPARAWLIAILKALIAECEQ